MDKAMKGPSKVGRRHLPTLKELVSDVDVYQEHEKLNYLLCQPVPKGWISKHPYIKRKDESGRMVPYEYLAIDKVEYLLRKIFTRYKIEILREGQSFNGVFVSVRVWYLDFITNEWLFHDGIGAIELQTKKGTTPSDLANINTGAVSMAYPLAKTLAIKDACDHFGDLFGSNLSRKNTLTPSSPTSDTREVPDEIVHAIELCTEKDQVISLANSKEYKDWDKNENFNNLIDKKLKELS